jgi:hypothetical protein
MKQTFERGFIFYNKESDNKTVVTLRQDVEEFLSELADRECKESDAALIAAHGIKALEEINEIHRNKQIEFEKDTVKFLFKKNESGESVPLTEQEQKDWIEAIEKNDQRVTH